MKTEKINYRHATECDYNEITDEESFTLLDFYKIIYKNIKKYIYYF